MHREWQANKKSASYLPITTHAHSRQEHQPPAADNDETNWESKRAMKRLVAACPDRRRAWESAEYSLARHWHRRHRRAATSFLIRAGNGEVRRECRGSSPNHRLVFRSWLSSFTEHQFLRLVAEPIMHDTGQFPQTRRQSRLRVPTVNQSPPLSFADDDSRALEAFELPLDSVERNRKIPCNRTTLAFPMMKQRQKHRLRRLASEEIL